MVLTYGSLTWCFDFTMVWNRYTFSRSCTPNFEFWSFPGLSSTSSQGICFPAPAPRGKLLSSPGHGAPAPSEPQDHEGEQWTHNHTALSQPFCLSLSVQYSIDGMRYSPLYYKIGFVLNDYAQLQAKVSALSTFKDGEAKLWCLVGWAF